MTSTVYFCEVWKYGAILVSCIQLQYAHKQGLKAHLQTRRQDKPRRRQGQRSPVRLSNTENHEKGSYTRAQPRSITIWSAQNPYPFYGSQPQDDKGIIRKAALSYQSRRPRENRHPPLERRARRGEVGFSFYTRHNLMNLRCT